MPSPTEITIDQLYHRIDAPDAPAIIDVCIDADFADDPRFIPTALRQPYGAITDLAPALRGLAAVVVCQKGRKLSQGAAALLRDADSLAGGNHAWRAAGLPLIPADRLPPRDGAGRTTWVTGNAPDLDRLAVAWLVRRFVDPRACILFVTPAEVAEVAEKFAARPFGDDHGGFAVLRAALALDLAPLARLASLLPGDSPAPEAAGLHAAVQGLTRLHRDDLALLDAAAALFGGFYRWARAGDARA